MIIKLKNGIVHNIHEDHSWYQIDNWEIRLYRSKTHTCSYMDFELVDVYEIVSKHGKVIFSDKERWHSVEEYRAMLQEPTGNETVDKLIQLLERERVLQAEEHESWKSDYEKQRQNYKHKLKQNEAYIKEEIQKGIENYLPDFSYCEVCQHKTNYHKIQYMTGWKKKLIDRLLK